MSSKMIILALDGLNFEVVDRFIERGYLPNIESLIKDGTRATLKSSIPYNTPCAWTTFQTGKSVRAHKVASFLYPDRGLENLKVFSSEDIRQKFFYELIGGLNICLVNLPYSYPPRNKNGYIIGSWLSPAGSIYPENLTDKIPQLSNYRILPQKDLRERKRYKAYIDDITEVEKRRYDVVKELIKLKDWDLFFVLFSGTDWIQHAFYDILLKAPSDSKLIKFYKNIDSYIGEIRNQFQDRDLFIMSDHGFGLCKRFFLINNWLYKEGYLKVADRKQPGGAGTLSRMLEGSGNCSRLLIDMYLRLKAIFPFVKFAEVKPDILESSAFCIDNTSWGIHLNDRMRFEYGRLSPQGESVKKEIIDKLYNLKDPATGKGIFKDIYSKEKIGVDGNEIMLPDILFVMNEYYNFTHRLNSQNISFLDAPEGRTGMHSQDGLFIAHGPNIKSHCSLDSAKIVDLAPTILHIFDEAIPSDFEGSPLKGIFRDDSRIFKRDIKRSDIATSTGPKKQEIENKQDLTAVVKDRLKTLGYID